MQSATVVTGVGAVSALGIGIDAHWSALTQGRSGLARISSFDASGFSSPFGGQVPDLAAKNHVPKGYRKATKVMARDTEIALAAADTAAKDAGLTTRADEPEPMTIAGERLGCLIGAGLISADTPELAGALRSSLTETDEAVDLAHWGAEGMKGLPPLWMLKYLPNMPACHVTIVHGARGPSNTIVCGEASGLLSIGEAVRVLERGAADACFAGGAESKLNPMGIARLESWKRVAKADNDTAEPWHAIRPFDPDAPGSIPGEGGGVLIVETASSANARGARALARVLGQGSSQAIGGRGVGACLGGTGGPCDGINQGLADAMMRAIDDAGLSPDQIDAVVPQAIGLPPMDLAEVLALRDVFGNRLSEIPLITLSPYMGDLIAGGGAIQAAVGVKAIAEQRLPARLHAGSPEPDLLAGPGESVPAKLNHVLVACASLAGQCAAVVFGRVT